MHLLSWFLLLRAIQCSIIGRRPHTRLMTTHNIAVYIILCISKIQAPTIRTEEFFHQGIACGLVTKLRSRSLTNYSKYSGARGITLQLRVKKISKQKINQTCSL